MSNRFDGDPRLYQGVDGSYLIFKGGQPVMDQGLENQAEIGLLTTPGWVGNFFLPVESQIGSEFINQATGTITITTLNNIRQEGEKAMAASNVGEIISDVINPSSNQIKASFILRPSAGEQQKIELTGSGSTWIGQATDPAYRKDLT